VKGFELGLHVECHCGMEVSVVKISVLLRIAKVRS